MKTCPIRVLALSGRGLVRLTFLFLVETIPATARPFSLAPLARSSLQMQERETYLNLPRLLPLSVVLSLGVCRKKN